MSELDLQLEKIQDFLYALRNAGSKYSLERIEKFCAKLGNPQNDFPKIHIAGTNGKGSVCAMLESILRATGLKVGMFTSPHLTYLGERIQINRKPIEKLLLAELSLELKKCVDSIFSKNNIECYPSFFEFMTAMAFLDFSRNKVDCAVVEVGLGGRLDSTNIITPDLSVITSIGFDHIQMLGATLTEIAREKAGIIKAGVPVVCGFLPDEAMAEIEKIARQKNAPLYKVSDYFPTDDSLPTTSLFGYYQKRNGAVALLCAKVLRELAEKNKVSSIYLNLTDEIAKKSLMHVEWSARWQTIKLANGARLIVDASHNDEGAKNLESNLAELYNEGVRPIITVGVLGEDRAVPLLKVISKYAKKIILLQPNQPRALPVDELRKCLGDCAVEVETGKVSDIYKKGYVCTCAEPSDTVISTGSIYLAGEVLASIDGNDADNLQDIPYK